MKAIEFSGPNSARFVEVPEPVPGPHDLLVAIEAVAVNPVDTKVRPAEGGDPMVLGYDAAGTVVATGAEVTGFAVGDAVYHAGDVTRPGTNSERHLVDARIAGHRPSSLDPCAAAALPLTALTAWEALSERLGIDLENGGSARRSLLIIGGAGGVGSIAIQLAKHAGLHVIATASRDESSAWCREMGADHVVNHGEDLGPQMERAGFATVDYIANFNRTDAYWEVMGRLIAPLGKVVLIVEPTGPLNLGGDYKKKSVAVAWEFMFTRSMFGTADLGRQGEILDRVAALVDAGKLRTTANHRLTPINPANLIEAHRQLESGRTVGKFVLSGWEPG